MLPLHSSLCVFIPALLYDATLEEIETFGRMAQALRQTWLTNSSFVVLPEKGAEPPGHLAIIVVGGGVAEIFSKVFVYSPVAWWLNRFFLWFFTSKLGKMDPIGRLRI